MPGFVRRFFGCKAAYWALSQTCYFPPRNPLLDPARRLKAGTGKRTAGRTRLDTRDILARKDARGVRLFTGNGYDFRNVVAAPVAEHVERDR